MKQIKIGIVVGATNEQGYLSIIQALNEPLFLELFTPMFFGSTQAAVKAKDILQKDEEYQVLPANFIKDPKDALDGRINFIVGHEERHESMSATVKAYMDNALDAIAIVPQDKNLGFDYKAAVEDSSKVIEADVNDTLVWKINDNVRVLSLNGMPDIHNVVKSLRKDFLFIKPHIAVMSKDQSLHEQFVELRKEGIMVFGPFDPDQVVDEGTYKPYDCLIFADNKNAADRIFSQMNPTYTYYFIAGMPMVMTSAVDNDNPQNLLQAIYAATDICRNRSKYRHATKSPLEKHWIPRGKDDFKLDLTKEVEETN